MPQVSSPSRPKLSQPPRNTQSAGQEAQAHPSQLSRSISKSPTQSKSSVPAFRLSFAVQNEILACFARAFATTLSHASLPSQIRALKSHLYDRDFIAAFGSAENRAAYAARWSPSRALAYAELVLQEEELWQALCTRVEENAVRIEPDGRDGGPNEKTRRSGVVTCLGGGAGAELVGLVAAERLRRAQDGSQHAPDGEKPRGGPAMHIFDLADWRDALHALEGALPRGPITSGLSRPSGSNDFQIVFHQQDVMQPDDAVLGEVMRASALITILFTLNELYAASLAQTTALLKHLGAVATPGTLLLVVDSPGSYSTIQMGGTVESQATKEGAAENRRYPMHWLLDRTLLGPIGNVAEARNEDRVWDKILEDKARWFRRADVVAYPIELEDMRYQVHLFKRR